VIQELANAAIYYVPDMVDTSRPKLMGRHAAGEGFVRAFGRHAEVDRYYCCAPRRADADDFARRLQAAGGAQREVVWLRQGAPAAVAKAGCLFVGEPVLARHAWQRRPAGNRAYSICGITHTTASAGVMSGIADMLVAPVQSWDAVICTSDAVRRMVERLLDNWQDYLADRLGAATACRPQLATVPLGVDADALAGGPAADAARREWRDRLGIGADDVAALFVGRLSFHAKANPLPMYLAMQRAATASGRRLHLIQAGWFANDYIEQAFRDGARELCPAVNAIFLDGREPNVRRQIWFAADLFTTLSDNIQETFGLTPIEAMAAGLPVVASDWDGYRDTVIDGLTGYMIPTVMPPPGLGRRLAYEHETGALTYDRYIGSAGRHVAVDVAACTEAYARLIGDADLRRRMGAAGRTEARRRFDWRVVVRAYQELWAELGRRRATDGESAPLRPDRPANPTHEDPFALFAHYATGSLGPDDAIVPGPGADGAAVARLRALRLCDPTAETGVPDAAVVAALEKLVAAGRLTVADLLEGVAPEQRAGLHLALLWLAKCDLVRRADET